MWDKIGIQVLVLGPQNYGHIDWTRYAWSVLCCLIIGYLDWQVSPVYISPLFCWCRFEGIIVDSLEANISRYDLATVCANCKIEFIIPLLCLVDHTKNYILRKSAPPLLTQCPRDHYDIYLSIAPSEFHQVIVNHTLTR